MGYAVNEIVTETGRHRRDRRPAPSHPARCRVSRRARDEHAEDGSRKSHTIIEGFGNVGSVALFRLLQERRQGCRDQRSHAAIYNPKGIDVKSAEQHMIKK